jgi:hypothetical protein
MSFMDSLGKMAEGLVGGASPKDAAAAASDHVQGMDPSELAGHLTQSVGSMDPSALQGLGQQLLATFTKHEAFAGDGAQAAAAAGTDADAVASGSPNAISALIGYAKDNPAVLQSAASAFLERNPGAIGQLAPGLLSGIMARLKSAG